MTRTGAVFTDARQTPQATSDHAGRVVWQAEYEPFGRAAVAEDPDGDGQRVVNNLRFPGR